MPSCYTFARMDNRKGETGAFEIGLYNGGLSGGGETVGDEEGWGGEVLLRVVSVVILYIVGAGTTY
jgi:hypothetical protein